MTKDETIYKLKTKVLISEAEADAILDAFISAISESIKRNDHVSLKGFGAFQTGVKDYNLEYDPRTNTTKRVTSLKTVRFNQSPDLIAKLNPERRQRLNFGDEI